MSSRSDSIFSPPHPSNLVTHPLSSPPLTSATADPLHQLLSDADARELIRAARQLDARALTRLYQLFAHRVFRFIYYRLHDRTRAEELTAEVFVRMLEGIGTFRSRDADAALVLNSWIFTIARHLVIDETRRQRTRGVMEDLETFDETQMTHDAIEFQLTRADLRDALARLTEEQQTVLLLRFEEGWTSAQIARMMDKTEMAVKALQRRGLATMARLLRGAPQERVHE